MTKFDNAINWAKNHKSITVILFVYFILNGISDTIVNFQIIKNSLFPSSYSLEDK